MKMCGVDPGSKGALSFINERGILLSSHRIPTYQHVMSSGKKRTRVNAEALARLVKSEAPDEVWIEDVHSRPKDGHVGAFAFGRNLGTLIGCFAACGVPTRFISPSAWKDTMCVKADKSTSIARAAKLFPGSGTILKTADHAESALIALYGLMVRRSERS